MTKPYSIRIFLPAGDPDGIRVIEKSNWNGSGLVFPRSLFGDAKSRRELERTGVYVLVGSPEESGLPAVYIGEGDPIRNRLESHAKQKEFWIYGVAFTSKDENLNKAHVQYLEARLVKLAMDAKRCSLQNGNAPQLPSMSEADAADAEGFLSEMLLCFPVIGLNVFSQSEPARRPSAEFLLSARGVQASGYESPQGFTVREGSTAARDHVKSCHDYLVKLRLALIENGVLASQDGVLRFSQDYVFASPSTAAGVVLGRTSNGRVDWKTKAGKSLKDHQETSSG